MLLPLEIFKCERISAHMLVAWLVLVALGLGLMVNNSQASERVALVIGNSAYKNAGLLKNPRNDAEGVAAALGKMGFAVIKGLDADRVGMRKHVREFTRQMKTAKLALFFYAGHGLQVADKNYLIPVDAALEEEADLDFEALDLKFVLQQMERSKRTNIVLLDACRNNPLARNLLRNMGTRSAFVGRGLARVETGVGTFVGFATQPGNVALDGELTNSPFTTALLKHFKEPGLDIGVLMRRVRQDVITQTGGQQVPWSNSSLVGDDVVLNTEVRQIVVEPKVASVTPTEKVVKTEAQPNKHNAGAANMAVELAFWDSVKDSKNPALINAYISQYPSGAFSDLARVMLIGLEGDKSKAAPQPVVSEEPKEPAEPEKPQKLASLGGELSANPVPDEPAGSEFALVENLQGELNRLGCSAGRADGQWGRNSRAALQRFTKYAGLSFDSYEPTSAILKELRGYNSRVCPIVCGARYKLSGGRCRLKSCRAGQILTKRGKCVAKTWNKPVVQKRKKRYKAPEPTTPAIEQERRPKAWENEREACPKCLSM